MALVKESHLAGRHFNWTAAQKPWDMVASVGTAQCNSFSLLFTDLARAQVHAYMERKSPTETNFLFTLGLLEAFFKKIILLIVLTRKTFT